MDRHRNTKDIYQEVKERSLPQCLNRCPNHKLSALTDISLDDCGSKLVFKCRECQKSSKYVEIKEIAFSEDTQIFDHYPILPQDLRQKIREIFEYKPKQNMVYYIRSYFKNLKIQILKSISDKEEEMVIKAQQIDSFQKNLIDEYNKQSRKMELRDIIFDDQNITLKSEQVKTIVKDVVNKSSLTKQKLMEMIGRFNQTNEDIKSQNLSEISSSIILSCIQQINIKENMKINQINEIEIFKEQNKNQIKKLIRKTTDINKIKLKAGKQETIGNKNSKRNEQILNFDR